MTGEVKRYDLVFQPGLGGGIGPKAHGKYMEYADHLAVVEGLRARVAELETVGKRVIAAFEALGRHTGAIDVIPRLECEASMAALKAAIDEAKRHDP